MLCKLTKDFWLSNKLSVVTCISVERPPAPHCQHRRMHFLLIRWRDGNKREGSAAIKKFVLSYFMKAFRNPPDLGSQVWLLPSWFIRRWPHLTSPLWWADLFPVTTSDTISEAKQSLCGRKGWHFEIRKCDICLTVFDKDMNLGKNCWPSGSSCVFDITWDSGAFDTCWFLFSKSPPSVQSNG